MDLSLIISIVGGLLGGNVMGMLSKGLSMGGLGNTIAGALGGAGAGWRVARHRRGDRLAQLCRRSHAGAPLFPARGQAARSGGVSGSTAWLEFAPAGNRLRS